MVVIIFSSTRCDPDSLRREVAWVRLVAGYEDTRGRTVTLGSETNGFVPRNAQESNAQNKRGEFRPAKYITSTAQESAEPQKIVSPKRVAVDQYTPWHGGDGYELSCCYEMSYNASAVPAHFLGE
jgi:hypothetical protein